MDITRRGKFNTNLWVKADRRRGQHFHWHQFRIIPLLKHPSNAPHGWCVHKPQPNSSMSVGPYTCAIDGARELDPAPKMDVCAHLPPSRHHLWDYNDRNSRLWRLAPI